MWREIIEQLHIANEQNLLLSSNVASGDSSEGSTRSLWNNESPNCWSRARSSHSWLPLTLLWAVQGRMTVITMSRMATIKWRSSRIMVAVVGWFRQTLFCRPAFVTGQKESDGARFYWVYTICTVFPALCFCSLSRFGCIWHDRPMILLF